MRNLAQEVYQVKDTETTLILLSKYQREAKLLAGGTDLIIQMREGHVKPRVLIDISSLKDTCEIKVESNTIEIGGTVTFTDIDRHEAFQGNLSALANAARSIGSPQIRNRATVGGNICNASPAADMLPPLLAMEAMVVLKSQRRVRVLALSEFITGKEKTVLEPDELMGKIRFQKLGANAGLGFSKLGVRNALAIARLSMAVYVTWDNDGTCLNIRIASGALGIKAQREHGIEDFLKGKKLTPQNLDEASKRFEEETVQRLAGRSTVHFKRHAVKGVFRQAINEAMQVMEGEEVHETSGV